MKTVPFCGGLGTRTRDVSESIQATIDGSRPAHGIQARRLLASNGSLKNKRVLEDLVDKGTMPWRLDGASRAASSAAERKIG